MHRRPKDSGKIGEAAVECQILAFLKRQFHMRERRPCRFTADRKIIRYRSSGPPEPALRG